MTKIIIDDPNLRRGNPDNEDMRTTVLINDDTTPWEEKPVDKARLTSSEPVRNVHREPKTVVHSSSPMQSGR